MDEAAAPHPLSVAERLDRAMNEKGVPVRTLARQLAEGTEQSVETVRSYVYRWLDGVQPERDWALRLALILGTPQDEFLRPGPPSNGALAYHLEELAGAVADREETIRAHDRSLSALEAKLILVEQRLELLERRTQQRAVGDEPNNP